MMAANELRESQDGPSLERKRAEPISRVLPAAIEAPHLAWALDTVSPPRTARRLAVALGAAFFVLPVILLFLPWTQNIAGTGRVTAFNPLDRTQVLPAPVTGLLVELHVQEGDLVRKGEVLAVMADQDPDYTDRLQRQLDLSVEKAGASRDMVSFYNQQLVFLEDAREEAISEAGYQLNVAIEEVRAEEQALSAAEAEYEQKLADRERKWTLWQRGVVSELDFQKAEADYLAAKAKVGAGKAKVEQSRNKENAKMAAVRKISNDQRAKIESTKSAREDARTKAALAEKDLTEANTKLERQRTQVVLAPRDGYILRVHASTSANLLAKGAPLIELIPDTSELAVELWVRGNDAPLVSKGRKVRLQFEGWPAVQFAGWPSVAVGTFGGVVTVVDAFGTTDGRFRVLVTPDPDDAPWPNRRFLRQGGRSHGWVLLDEVSAGYEIWRQLNAFPPSVKTAPGSAVGGSATKPSKSSMGPGESGMKGGGK